MNETYISYTVIYHICETNTDIIKQEIFKLKKNRTPYLFFSTHVFRSNRILY